MSNKKPPNVTLYILMSLVAGFMLTGLYWLPGFEANADRNTLKFAIAWAPEDADFVTYYSYGYPQEVSLGEFRQLHDQNAHAYFSETGIKVQTNSWLILGKLRAYCVGIAQGKVFRAELFEMQNFSPLLTVDTSRTRVEEGNLVVFSFFDWFKASAWGFVICLICLSLGLILYQKDIKNNRPRHPFS